MLIGIVAVVVAVIAGATLYWYFTRQPSIPWLFRGAYAKYHGETTVLFVPVKADLRTEVVDYNATHVKLLEYFKIETPLGTREFQNVSWYDLIKKSYEIEGYTLKRTYEQEVYLESTGTRKCIVYEYEHRTGGLMTLYVDKEVMWPIKIRFSSEAAAALSIDLNLVESNIPGLMK